MILIESDESDEFMLLAADEAAKSVMKFKLGAVITDRKGRILGRGFNSTKTHPLGSKDYKTLHAEIAALYDCLKKKKDVRNSVIYIFRKNSHMAKPCPCCEATLKKFGIKKIIYTNNL